MQYMLFFFFKVKQFLSEDLENTALQKIKVIEQQYKKKRKTEPSIYQSVLRSFLSICRDEIKLRLGFPAADAKGGT